MRFICFHGRGTNAKFFKTQTAKLRQALGSRHDFVFIDGPFEADPAPGTGVMEQTARRWSPKEASDTNIAHYQNIYEDIMQFVAIRGPFDGVVGFSEGGAIAAALLLADAQSYSAGFKCGLFFCAATPQHPDWLSGKELRDMDAAVDGIAIDVPTAHIWSDKGEIHPGMGCALAQLCRENVRSEFVHGLGHDIPGARSNEGFREALRAVERTLDRAKDYVRHNSDDLPCDSLGSK